MTLINIVLLLGAYLIGSIPTAVWIGKSFYGIDVREYGSGNAGATNTFRVLGKKAGIPVLLIDILKGFFAVKLVYFQSVYAVDSIPFINLQLAFGIAALLGHIFPVFAAFRGGKGIATLLGIIFAILPEAALASLVIFLIVLIISKYVSLGSMLAGIAFPIFVNFIFETEADSLKLFSAIIAVLVLVTHQKNITRLIQGAENKTYLIKKRT
ncbi:MAG: glycerol-3-phosphate 1-O-acyltransferase PlsY [Bacteroidetes bacterium]|nr:glycerol-3-phosphate 1-O-acyltransferase PlsY [Bacteroidota bacterium]